MLLSHAMKELYRLMRLRVGDNLSLKNNGVNCKSQATIEKAVIELINDSTQALIPFVSILGHCYRFCSAHT